MAEYQLNIEELLEKKGKSVPWLAKEIDVQPRTVKRWINGGSIEFMNLFKLVHVLECKVEDILEINDTYTKKTPAE